MRPALVISDRDNVATALEALQPGRELSIGGRTVVVRDVIPSGHKVALQPIAAGDPVVKYGSPIGTASATIEPGEHVHVHNVASGRGRGDLESARQGQARLAEPPDELPRSAPSDGARGVTGRGQG